MKITPQVIMDFKQKNEKRLGIEIPYEKAAQQVHLAVEYATFAVDLVFREEKLCIQLHKEPDEFPLPDTGKCIVCEVDINSHTGWYSRYGKTCLFCFDAFVDGTLPYFVIDPESYFSFSDVQQFFKLRPNTITKLMRNGTLKPRTIYTATGTIHYQVFLKKENPALHEYPNPFRKSIRRYGKRLFEEQIQTIFMKYSHQFS